MVYSRKYKQALAELRREGYVVLPFTIPLYDFIDYIIFIEGVESLPLYLMSEVHRKTGSYTSEELSSDWRKLIGKKLSGVERLDMISDA